MYRFNCFLKLLVLETDCLHFWQRKPAFMIQLVA